MYKLAFHSSFLSSGTIFFCDDKNTFFIIDQASEVHVHPNYDPEVLDSDIALIRLATRATLTDRVSPICLPGYNSDGIAMADRLIRPGSNITVTGWGETENRTDAGVLMEAVLGTISRESCEDKYAESGKRLKMHHL